MSTIIDFYWNLHPLLRGVINALAVIFVIFPIAGACSLAERKVSALLQGRPGPNRALPPLLAWVPGIRFIQRLGLFHLACDGAKFLFKEDPIPGHVNKFFYTFAPIFAIVPAMTTVCTVPVGAFIDSAGSLQPLILANVDIGILFVFAFGSLGVYALILGGWASNSKYPFLSAVRASAQLISYELSLTLAVIPVFLWINSPDAEGTLSLFRVVEFQSKPGLLGGAWFGFLMPLSALIFLVALFAETNRLPFDMAESEADLVGGFHTEYGAFKFGFFFVAEYGHMIVGSAVFMLLFFGGWNPLPWLPLTDVAQWLHFADKPIIFGLVSIAILLAKVIAMLFFFMWVRWTVPRFRYDQVMNIGWRRLLPLSIANLLIYAIAIAMIQK